MDKVYVLNGSKGSYDDHYNFVVGIYTSMELAEEAKKETIENIRRMSIIYTPKDVNRLDSELQKEFNTDEYKKTYKLSKKMRNYFSWKNGFSPQEYNIDSYRIVEYELNQTPLGISMI